MSLDLSIFDVPDHASFSDWASQLVYGKRADGEVVHVSQVPSGLACGCVCPACEAPLVARKGEVLRHHFAHRGLDAACRYALETNLHAMAKEVLARERRLVLFDQVVELGGFQKVAFEGREMTFDAVRLERRIGHIVPDVVLTVGERELLVEVFVTHRCDAKKIEKIRAAGLPTLEIDLSKCRGLSPEEVELELVETAPRSWIFNRRIEEVKRELETYIAARQAQERRVRERRVSEMVSAIKANPAREGCRLRDELKLVTSFGYAGLTTHVMPGEAGFLGSAQDWKVAILARWVLPDCEAVATRPEMKGLPEIFKLVEDLVVPIFRKPIDRETRVEVAEIVPEVMLPFWAVREFVDLLEERGVLQGWAGRSWFVSPKERDRARVARDAKALRDAREASNRAVEPKPVPLVPADPLRDPAEQGAVYDGLRAMQAAIIPRRSSKETSS